MQQQAQAEAQAQQQTTTSGAKQPTRQDRTRCRDVLKNVILLSAGLTIFWLEQALNLIFTVILVALVCCLLWLAFFTAISTSFLWLPVCLICLPMLITVGILLRFTRLQGMVFGLLARLHQEPLKSQIWSNCVLYLSQSVSGIYFRVFPDKKACYMNSGYALLSMDGIIKTEGIFSKLNSRTDIFQLQLYYYVALQATRLESLEGLRVLDVSHGQADNMKFLARYFSPSDVIGYDSVKKVFTSGKFTNSANVGGSNLPQLLSSERRFDLILCVETWNKLANRESFLHHARELLNQSSGEQDQAPYVEDDFHQRLIIADIFRKDEEPQMKALLSNYFEIEDIIDISINVQKSINKQRDRRQKFLADSSHLQIGFEACRQFRDQFSSQCFCPLGSPLLSYISGASKKGASNQTPLFLDFADRYDRLQGRVHGCHSFLIYVLKHKTPLEDSQILTLQN